MDDGQEWELKFLDALEGNRNPDLDDILHGAVNSRGVGIGVILISSEGEMILMAKRLEFEVTNNQAEYEACIFGLEPL